MECPAWTEIPQIDSNLTSIKKKIDLEIKYNITI